MRGRFRKRWPLSRCRPSHPGLAPRASAPRGLVAGLIAASVGWVVWAGVIFIVGTKLLPEPSTKADFGQLLRTIGFAASPGILNILGVIPLLGLLVRFVVWIWQLVATVVAVRQALDYKSTGKAVVVCLVGFVAYLFVAFWLAAFLGLGGLLGR